MLSKERNCRERKVVRAAVNCAAQEGQARKDIK